MNDIEKYFSKFTIASLGLIMPSAIFTISIFSGIFIPDLHRVYSILMKLNYNPVLLVQITSYCSVLICFIDIIIINSAKKDSPVEINRIYRKSLMDVAVIFINASYTIFIFLFSELDKLGNIPVGRN